MSDVSSLAGIVRRLRGPDGCPWDREQTHATLRPCLIEECYEVVEAIERADDGNLREELGDLLLQVVMHSEMAKERGAFTFDDVIGEICEKLVRRHPHVFAQSEVSDSAGVLRQWEQIKRAEKGSSVSVLSDLPKALPALVRAQKVQKKAARVGFDWESATAVFEKLREEISEVEEELGSGTLCRDRVEDEVGDLLFAVVNLARHLQVDSEVALTRATGKFVGRFQSMEQSISKQGRQPDDLSAPEWDAEWEAAKLRCHEG